MIVILAIALICTITIAIAFNIILATKEKRRRLMFRRLLDAVRCNERDIPKRNLYYITMEVESNNRGSRIAAIKHTRNSINADRSSLNALYRNIRLFFKKSQLYMYKRRFRDNRLTSMLRDKEVIIDYKRIPNIISLINNKEVGADDYLI